MPIYVGRYVPRWKSIGDIQNICTCSGGNQTNVIYMNSTTAEELEGSGMAESSRLDIYMYIYCIRAFTIESVGIVTTIPAGSANNVSSIRLMNRIRMKFNQRYI
jgi:hypothetical protein